VEGEKIHLIFTLLFLLVIQIIDYYRSYLAAALQEWRASSKKNGFRSPSLSPSPPALPPALSLPLYLEGEKEEREVLPPLEFHTIYNYSNFALQSYKNLDISGQYHFGPTRAHGNRSSDPPPSPVPPHNPFLGRREMGRCNVLSFVYDTPCHQRFQLCIYSFVIFLTSLLLKGR
jgi:hypothetical protein